MDMGSFEKGLNQIKLEKEEDKKKETVKIEPRKVTSAPKPFINDLYCQPFSLILIHFTNMPNCEIVKDTKTPTE